MKDLTRLFSSFMGEKNIDLEEDIKVSKSKIRKYAGFIASGLGISIYLLVSISFGTSVPTILMWLLFLVSINVNNAIDVYFTSKREKRNALQNLRDLSIELERNDVDVNTERLTKALVKESTTKEKVEYMEVQTRERILNHTKKTNERNYFFMDSDNKIRCLKEIEKIIKDSTGTEREHTLHLLEDHEFNENDMEEKDIKKLRKRYEKRN